MSFLLEIRVARGFEPPVTFVPPEPDPDRTEEEERVWHELLRARAKDAAWAPYSMTLTMRTVASCVEVLTRAGALFATAASPVRKALPRGPNGEVDARKLGSNDGWHLTAAECRFVAERLSAWLDAEKEEPEQRPFLAELAAFFSRAAEHKGLKVR